MSVTTFTTVNGRILRQNKDGVVHNFVSDPLGSVVMVRDTSGNTVYEAEYDPYGNVQSETGTNPSSLGYVGTLGYIKDSATSMYVRARYLLNNLGRWLTKDLLWPSEPGFVYANSAPSVWVDPTGHIPISLMIMPFLPPKPDCKSILSDIVATLIGTGNPWVCGSIRRCIGQYLSGNPGCGFHGGGHGFSGGMLAGCCLQIEIDLCKLFGFKDVLYPSGGLVKIPACLDKIIRDFYKGSNPADRCVYFDTYVDPFECPPGYCWSSFVGGEYGGGIGVCSECTFMWPE